MRRGTTIPDHELAQYASVVDHYIKERHTSEVFASTVLQDEDDIRYGYRGWQLPTWTSAAQYRDSYDDVAFGSPTSPLDVQLLVEKTRDAQARDWTAVRPEEIIRHTYGGNLPPDALNIPIPILRERTRFSYQPVPVDPIRGTVQVNLSARLNGKIPRRFFGEWGIIQVWAYPRMSILYRYSQEYLDRNANVTPQKLLAHPVQALRQPLDLTLRDAFSNSSSTTSIGYIRRNDWYRKQVGYINPAFDDVDSGWMLAPSPSTKDGAKRHPDLGSQPYDIFTSTLFGAGSITGRVSVSGHRPIGNARQTVMSSDNPRLET